MNSTAGERQKERDRQTETKTATGMNVYSGPRLESNKTLSRVRSAEMLCQLLLNSKTNVIINQ